MTTEPPATHEPDAAFERLPVLSQIESDRFCEGCGYNLRMQGVRRDPRLDLLMVRCPECNRYHPVALAGTARQVWWQRIAALLIVLYLLVVLGLVAGLGAAEVGITVGTLEELSRHYWDNQHQQRSQLMLVEQPDHPDYRILMALSSAGALATGYVGVALAALLFHHRRPWEYAAYAAAIPCLSAVIVIAILVFAPPYVTSFAYPYLAWFTTLYIVGGLLAVRTSRPITRAVARLILPPGLRAHLSFLWTADGLEPPSRGA